MNVRTKKHSLYLLDQLDNFFKSIIGLTQIFGEPSSIFVG